MFASLDELRNNSDNHEIRIRIINLRKWWGKKKRYPFLTFDKK